MSYDIIILKPMGPGTDDLANVDEVLEIGDEASVLRSLAQVFPGCIQGIFAKDESFTVEGSLSGKPVTSIHLSLRFGTDWSDSSFNVFLALLSELCDSLQTHAFSVSDNTLVTAPSD
ncbi:hypothetical protein [Pseudomonas costantinii]|uniref:hypothetical protein n=1 Tax=Pseudomonas costantinii TaxID=168469 RepID=UPI0015A31310|nr:hypothetical protein [Pseudomonas costantinii]NVZ72571.1 hypothetical protein [Pseudomonas costantinii]